MRFTTVASLLGLGALGLLLAGCPGAADLEGDYSSSSGGTGNTAGTSATGGAGTGNTGGGGAGAGGTGVTTPDCSAKEACVTTTFMPCLVCHGGPTSLDFEKLDLSTSGLATRLVNVAARHETGGPTCPTGDKLIDTGTPANSWLLKKITKDGPGTCGTAMPSAPGLSADEISCVSTWINCLAGK